MDAGFLATLQGFKLTSRKHRIADDDFIDRINHYFTPMIIIVFSIIVCAKQYIVGEPLQCWVPAHYHGSWEQYAENYCWVKNTYFVYPENDIPDDHGDRRKQELGYYQWVPFVLALQALMFYIPCVFWRMLNRMSGVNIKSLAELANDVSLVDPKKRSETVNLLSRHIHHNLVVPREHRLSTIVKAKAMLSQVLCCGDAKRGNYLSILYIFTKLAYIGNIVGQFFLLNAFLGTNYSFFGYEILRDIYQGRQWQHSSHFPRVTMCDFTVRVLGNLQRHTIQCVLVINLFNEKIYIFLWFWLVLVAIATTGSTIAWVLWMMWPGRRLSSVSKYLHAEGMVTDREQVQDFADNYLRQDGVFVLKMIAFNCGEPIVHELVIQLWKDYKKKIDDDDVETLTTQDGKDIEMNMKPVKA